MTPCEAAGLRMCIHPDDPAYPVFGIPRILSRSEDVERLFKAVPSAHSGLTLSDLAARADQADEVARLAAHGTDPPPEAAVIEGDAEPLTLQYWPSEAQRVQPEP